MNTPIAFIVFNRPRQTKTVFEALRKIRPRKLYVIADGPRTDDERKLCNQVRAIIDTIDWECDLKKKYSETNLGCGINESRGLDWVFENEDQAIILEDDCLPHPSFFPFCEQMLEKYKNNSRVMHISGNFFHQNNKKFHNKYSYFVSILPHVWGWATWRRAWKKYDYELNKWPEEKKARTLIEWFKNPSAYEYWTGIWDEYKTKNINNYDARWVFACMINRGLCLNPTVNLITNIGFDEQATHSKTPDESANLPSESIEFPLKHPPELIIDYQADAFTFRKNFGIDEKLRHRILRPIKNHFPRLYWKVRNLLRLNEYIRLLSNIQKRIQTFKNWPFFVWPLNKLKNKNRITKLRNGIKIMVRDIHGSDFSIAMEIFSLDYYLSKEILISKPKVIVDVGANIGIFSILAAKAFPEAKIYAIEPEQDNFNHLNINIKLNNLDNIIPIRALVSDKKGKEKLYISKHEQCHSIIPIIPERMKDIQAVDSITLESFNKIDILKVDVEGAEYKIFGNYIPDCDFIAMEIHHIEGQDSLAFINKFREKYSIENRGAIYRLKRLQ